MLRAWNTLVANWELDDGPTWRMVPWLLLAAYALRMAMALSSDYTWRIDESMQYLEQAHRAVFGYGFKPWEYEVGVRTWLVSVLPIAVLQVCSWVGFDHPDYYIPAVRIVNSSLSLAVPIGAYVLCRRFLNESTARAAFIIACFWYELIIMSPHTLAEYYATSLFFMAASLLRKDSGVFRAASVGMLLGLAFALRVHYVFAYATFGIIIICLYRSVPVRSALVGGGIAALLAWGLLDRLTWGGWWTSIINYYVEVNKFFANRVPVSSSIGGDLINLFIPSLGMLFVATAWGLIRIKTLFPITLPCLGILAFHLFIGYGAEYSNYQLFIVLCLIIMGDLSQNLFLGKIAWPHTRTFVSVAILAIFTSFSLAGHLPGMQYTEQRRNEYFFATSNSIWALRVLSRLPKDELKLVIFDSWFEAGAADGYYYLHQEVPLLLPGSNYQQALAKYNYGTIATQFASHVISDVPNCYPSFDVVGHNGTLSVLQRRLTADNHEQIKSPITNFDFVLRTDDDKFPASILEYFQWRENCLTGEK